MSENQKEKEIELIQVDEPLTKENFWDTISKKYPEASKMFYDWIDKYKKSSNWNSLFAFEGMGTFFVKSVKFHDLPHAMQMGIWFAFLRGQKGRFTDFGDLYYFDLAKHIDFVLEKIQKSFQQK